MADPDGAVVCEYNIYNLFGVTVTVPATPTIGKAALPGGVARAGTPRTAPTAGEILRRFEGLSG
tara:strand:+ start:252 stop:443 length:192 start_codon:yes stop_codon:yes gene_type:complete